MMAGGNSWIDSVPLDWRKLRLKDVGFLYGGLTGKSGEDFRSDDRSITKPFIPFTNILNNVYVNPNQVKYVVMSDEEQQNPVQRNDLLFLMSSEDYESIGKAAVVNDDIGEVYLNSFCKGFRITNKDVYPPFLCYQLLGDDCHDRIRIEAQGFTRINIQTGKISSAFIAIPKFQEQVKIVSYLDKMLCTIDNNVAKWAEELNRLRIFKQAIINEIVVKGLHNDCPMKDSGEEWLGVVPSHWEIGRIGSYFEDRREQVSDLQFPPLSVTKQGIFPQIEGVAKTENGENRKKVCVGDFVINSRSDRKGSSGVSKYEGSVSLINIVLKPNDSIVPDYCNYLFKSNRFIEEYYRAGHGIVADLWTTGYNEMRTINIALPPLDEQAKITAYLDDECDKIDRKCALIEQQIEKLQLLKRALVNEVVTGKRQIQ